jgi:hypothetical protein
MCFVIRTHKFLQIGHMKEWLNLGVGWESYLVGDLTNVLYDLIGTIELGS